MRGRLDRKNGGTASPAENGTAENGEERKHQVENR
jgi:hypothetical protein